MRDAIIAHFQVVEPGEHCVLNKQKMDAALNQAGGIIALMEHVSPDELVGALVAIYRKRAGKNSKELGAAIDFSDATINRIENGTKPLNRDLTIKLNAVLPGLRNAIVLVNPDC